MTAKDALTLQPGNSVWVASIYASGANVQTTIEGRLVESVNSISKTMTYVKFSTPGEGRFNNVVFRSEADAARTLARNLRKTLKRLEADLERLKGD